MTVAAVARDGRHVALGGGPSVRILDVRPGHRCRQIELPNPQEVHAVALNLSSDGSVAVVATDDGIARVYDIRRRTQLATLFAGWRQEARLSMRDGVGGGLLIFTAGDDGRVRQWQVGALPLADRFSTARVDAAAIRPDGRLVGAVGGRVLAARWERAGAARRVGSAPNVDAAVFDRRGEQMAYTTRRDALVVMDIGGARRRIGGRDAGRNVTSLSFSADGRRLVTAQRSGGARVWDVLTGAPLRRISPPTGTTGRAFATFAADGAVLVADRGVRVHAPGAAAPRVLMQGTEVAQAPAGGMPAAVTAAGRLAVALDRAAPLSWSDLRGARPVTLDRAGRLVSALAFSPGGKVIATAGPNGVRLLEPASGQALALLSAGSFDRVAFSADGQWVLATARERGVQVFPCRPCGDREELIARVAAMQALVPVSPLDVPPDGALVPPLPPSPDAAPQASAPAPEAISRPILPTTPAPVPIATSPAPSTPVPDAGGGGGGDPISTGGGED